MALAFAKYEGLGNDFIVVEAADASGLDAAEAVALCDRHRGVGADGVLLLGARDGLPSMDVINADGSTPEMCGNGLRCVALHLARTGRAPGERFRIATGAGPHDCHVIEAGDRGAVEVSMRAASFEPAEVGIDATQPWLDVPLEVGGVTLRVSAASMGNPHAVSFDPVSAEARLRLGPLLGAHPRFARGANAGFAELTGTASLDLHVFERGAGWTQACGTGACAAAAAAVATGRVRAGVPLDVRLPGGVLRIVVGEPGERISMTGPARHVFDGVLTREQRS
jgi:diaminopimelate epimerase